MAAATSSATTCPVCLDGSDNAVSVNPCVHQLCFGCVRRWREAEAECPLCRRGV